MCNYLIDTHAHIDFEDYNKDFTQMLSRLDEYGVKKLVIPSNDVKSHENVLKIISEYKNFYGAIGLHPSSANEFNEQVLCDMKKYLKEEKIVAIGECGLDYYWDKDNKELQKEVFIEQIKLAKEFNKTLIVHDREAHGDTFDILKKYAENLNVILHCYSGSVEFAKECIKMGWKIGLGGVVTFKNAKNVHAVAQEISLENMVLETDCPFLTPEPHRGERNEPAYVKFVAENIANLKNIPIEDVIKTTTLNAEKIFGI